MGRIMLATFTVAVLIASGCGNDEGTSTEGTSTTDPIVEADLTVHVDHPDRIVDYRIQCGPESHTVTGADVDVEPEAACAALGDQAVVDRLVDGPPADQVCTEIYGGPDTAAVTGTVDGETVDATIDRKNGCGIHDWDVLLGPLLPKAVGVTADGEGQPR